MAIAKKRLVATRQTAKVFKNGASQAVRLPKEFRVDADALAIRKEGDAIILTPLYESWDDYRANAPKAGQDFVDAVRNRHEQELPLEERATFD